MTVSAAALVRRAWCSAWIRVSCAACKMSDTRNVHWLGFAVVPSPGASSATHFEEAHKDMTCLTCQLVLLHWVPW